MVINTEAHMFPRFKLAKGLKTGWERKPRDEQGHVIIPKQTNEATAAEEAWTSRETITHATQTIKVEEVKPTSTVDEKGKHDHSLA